MSSTVKYGRGGILGLGRGAGSLIVRDTPRKCGVRGINSLDNRSIACGDNVAERNPQTGVMMRSVGLIVVRAIAIGWEITCYTTTVFARSIYDADVSGADSVKIVVPYIGNTCLVRNT